MPHTPTEFYGMSVIHPAAENTLLTSQECPFLTFATGQPKRCIKIRKSDPTETIGACSAEQGGVPVVICPHRFLQRDAVIRDVAERNGMPNNWAAIPEVGIPHAGSVDFALVALTAAGAVAQPIVGLEFQTMDTTGSMYAAKQDYTDDALKERYQYGMNWAHIAKLTLVQAANKAPTFAAANLRYVWAVQDVLLDYIEYAYNFSGFRPDDASDPFAFYSYRMVLEGADYRLEAVRHISADIDGLLGTLRSERESEYDIAEAVAAQLNKPGTRVFTSVR